MDEHAPGCLQLRIEELVASRVTAFCPICHKGTVTVNADDFFECKSCHTQFNSGLAGPDDATTTKRTFLDLSYPHDITYIQIMSQKGHGDFPKERRIAEMCAERDKALAKFRRPRRKVVSSYQSDKGTVDVLECGHEVFYTAGASRVRICKRCVEQEEM
jgi:hypothetical protein